LAIGNFVKFNRSVAMNYLLRGGPCPVASFRWPTVK
jgi:hypothetical protein